jgi:predicted permease
MINERNIINKKKRKLVFAVIAISLPFCAFFFFELLLRIFFPQPPRGFSASLFTISKYGNTILRPGASGTQYSREFSVSITGNQFGYRDGTWTSDDLHSSLPKCVIIGDSFSFGWGVPAKNVYTNFLGS